MMNIPATMFLAIAASSSLLLGILVFWADPAKRTHRAFAVLALNLTFWTVGVLCIIQCHTEPAASFWVRMTFLVASFLPATFYHFIAVFPRQRFEGLKSLLALLYAGGVLSALGTFTPWYITRINVFPVQAPMVVYGPVFYLFAACVGLSMLGSFPNLFLKLRTASGLEWRQIEHVLLGIFLSTTLASATNVLAPIFNVSTLEPYGPAFVVLMMGFFAYAMVTYRLLDLWVIVSRTAMYATLTAFVVATFFGAVFLVHTTFAGAEGQMRVLPTVLAALIIAVVLEPLKEKVQLVLDRALVKRRYDTDRLIARISRHAARIIRLDELLVTICQDIRETVGVELIRIYLVHEKEENTLITEYSSEAREIGTRRTEFGPLLDFLRSNPDPLILEQLLHTRPTPQRARIAKLLAELDAYLCLPLMTTFGLIGVLTLGRKSSRDIYANKDLMVFTAVAGPVATAIENARLYRKLEEVNLHRARILSNMRGGVLAVDTQRKVSTVNKSATQTLGPIELGQDLETLTPQVAQVLRQTLEEQRSISDFETRITRPDGEEVPVAMSSSCLTTAEEGLTGAMVMIYDLTPVKRLEQNVLRADRLSSIGTMAAGMAHEIKNPLVSIKTFTQLLPNRYDDPDFRVTFTEVVPHEVERIDEIVSRLLDFARPKQVQFTVQNLRPIIEQVLALVDNQTRKAGIVVEREFPHEPIEVIGDEQELHQLVLNLVLNAIDALKEVSGGTLRVQAAFDHMHLRRNGQIPLLDVECVKVTVADTGPGIPADQIEHLFNPFYTTKENGCGLGLSVVHTIVTEHGGEIDVESTVNQGSSFVVALPLARSLTAAERSPS